MPGLATIKNRRDFLAANSRGKRIVTSCFLLLFSKRADDHPEGPAPRVGFTVTKKMGGAVARNRIKRRLREAVRLAEVPFEEGCDYIFISRVKALDCDFDVIIRDMRFAFSQIASK